MISRLADQKWPDLAGRRPLVVLPLGSCEQHGPHLPLDTDQAVAEAVAGACDLQGTGVNAVAVSPGSTRTAMLRAIAELYQVADAEQLACHQLVGRLLEPEEVALAVAWACSPEASAITGSVLYADGGFTG